MVEPEALKSVSHMYRSASVDVNIQILAKLHAAIPLACPSSHCMVTKDIRVFHIAILAVVVLGSPIGDSLIPYERAGT